MPEMQTIKAAIPILSYYYLNDTRRIRYEMNIWRQFNLTNQSFLSDWRILYWRMLLYLHSLGNKKRT